MLPICRSIVRSSALLSVVLAAACASGKDYSKMDDLALAACSTQAPNQRAAGTELETATLIGGRLGLLQPRDDALDLIYGNLPRIGIDLRHRFEGTLSGGIGLEVSKQSGDPIVIGTPLPVESEISIVSVPLTLQLNSTTAQEFRSGEINFYAGVGLSFFSVDEELRFGGNTARASASGTGFHVMAGLDIPLGESAYISPLVRFSREQLDESGGAGAEVGGLTIAIDFGIVF